ncbi:MAG: formyltetrahydrofolate deformylase [Candidatus Velthaea sp.]
MQLFRPPEPEERSPGAILTLSCEDIAGIVHAVSGFLLAAGCNIVDSAQFRDAATGRFFMRVDVLPVHEDDVRDWDVDALRARFVPVAERFGMTWDLRDRNARSRVLIMVSRQAHCLNDLLFRYSTGDLRIDIPAIVSNHSDLASLAQAYRVPFYHLPVTSVNKTAQEQRLLEIVDSERIELVVLARYMQIFSAHACAALAGHAINIHHSFLPSFRGAKPYHQAYARGVKIIGATAHYVTSDLDEGPIIEQDIARVTHDAAVSDLVATGRDIESSVLSRAVKLHVERRVLLNGMRTIVFR